MKVISLIGLIIILTSIFNGLYQEFIANDPEYYIPMILFVIGFFLFFIPALMEKKETIVTQGGFEPPTLRAEI